MSNTWGRKTEIASWPHVPLPFQDCGGGTGSGFVGGGQIGCDYQFASDWVIDI